MTTENVWPDDARCGRCSKIIDPPSGVFVRFTNSDVVIMHRACLLALPLPDERWRPYLEATPTSAATAGPIFAILNDENVTFAQVPARYRLCAGCHAKIFRSNKRATVVVFNEGEADEEELWFCSAACRDGAASRGALADGHQFGTLAIH